MKPHLVVINNLPVFYRTPAFVALQEAWYQHTQGRFTVIYQSKRDPNRRDDNFFTPDDELPYVHRFLSDRCDTSVKTNRYRPQLGARTWLQNKPTHVLAAGWDTPASIASQVYRRATRTRLCLWSESTASTSTRAGRMPTLYRKWAAKGADSYLFSTEAAKTWVEELAGHTLDRSLVLPNPMQGTRLPDDDRPCPRFVFLGDLSRRKGFDLLCDAMRRRPDWLCVAYGRDSEGLSMFEPPNVVWKGSQTSSTIHQALRASDVLVIPSRSDPAPLTFSEGLVLGLRMVVSPDIAYGTEYAGQTGIFVPTELTAAGLVSAMDDARTAARLPADVAHLAQPGHWANAVVEQCLL